MPVSKRDKKVSLTKTPKKGMKVKQELVENIRKSIESFNHLFIFSIHNMRNGPLKEVREEWKDSRFFFAKRKVMAIALGRSKAEEAQKNLHKVSSQLLGQCGLFFTNKSKDHVIQWFQDYSKLDFARSGFIATETVTLNEGPLPDFQSSIEPHLRKLGLPTKLEKGIIVLREKHIVCNKGDKLTPEQASLLKLLGKKLAEFKITLLCRWSKDDKSFEKFKIAKEGIITQENKTPKKDKKTSKETDKLSEPITMDIEDNTVELLPKSEMKTPSHKSPKPVNKKTPHQAKMSVKKLTTSAAKLNKRPKQNKTNAKTTDS